MTEENSKSLTVPLPLTKFKPHTSILTIQIYCFTILIRRLIFSYETLKVLKWKKGRRRSWYPNVTLDSHLYNRRKSSKFSLCPPVSSGRGLVPQHLKWKRRVIMKTEHEITLLGSYLMHSSSILLLSLVASFRAKDLRLNTWFRSSREHVCLNNEWYFFIHVLFIIDGEFSSYVHAPLMFILLYYLPILTFCLYV
jgi:hypothetical protein